ncbi:ABC transporter substrate-binding protein [soil metagenome]
MRARMMAVGTVLGVMATLAGCGSDDQDASSEGLDATTVTVGTLRGQPHFYAPFLYGDHEDEGVTYEVVTLDTAPALNDALMSGQVDFAVGSITATIAGAAQGRDIKVVAAAADGGSGFVGSEAVPTLEDLAGKKVGYLASSSQYVAMQLTLEAAGVDVDSFELVSLTAPEFFNAFNTGQIDAFAAPEIGVSLALANGGHELISLYDTEIGKVNIGLLTTQTLIEENPELVQAVVDTHAATTEYMAGSIDEWLPEMVAEYGAEQATLEHAMENFWLRADLAPSYQQQIDNLAEQMVRLGMIEEAPAEPVYDASFASQDEPTA